MTLPAQAAAVSPLSIAFKSLQGLARPSTRCSTTSASDTDDRKIWICWPSSSHRSWVTQRAPGLGAALGAAGLAAGGGDGLIHRHDDVGDAQFAGGTRQAIAAARAAHAGHQSAAPQLGEKLFQIGQRNVLALGDVGQATGLARPWGFGGIARPGRPSPSPRNVPWCSAAWQVSFGKDGVFPCFVAAARCKKRGPAGKARLSAARDIDFPTSLVKYSRLIGG